MTCSTGSAMETSTMLPSDSPTRTDDDDEYAALAEKYGVTFDDDDEDEDDR